MPTVRHLQAIRRPVAIRHPIPTAVTQPPMELHLQAMPRRPAMAMPLPLRAMPHRRMPMARPMGHRPAMVHRRPAMARRHRVMGRHRAMELHMALEPPLLQHQATERQNLRWETGRLGDETGQDKKNNGRIVPI